MAGRATYGIFAVVTVVLIIALSFYAFAPATPNKSTGGSSSLTSPSTGQVSSFQAENQTVIATYVTSLPTAVTTILTSTSTYVTTSTSTTATATYATSTQSLTTGGGYTYTPSSQVKILSVAATVSGSQPGNQALSFSVQFQNIGSSTIYVESGGGSSLNSTITSGASIIDKITGPRCEIAVALTPVAPGDARTATTPGCWSGFSYRLLEPGTIGVRLTLAWSNGITSNYGSSHIEIYAQFSLN